MLSVQNYNFTTNRNVAFRGKSEDTETTTKPFQTHAGLKLGVATGAISAVGYLAEGKLADKLAEFIKNGGKEAPGDIKSTLESIVGFMKSGSKAAKILAPATAVASVGCGVAVDMAANKKHAQIAELKDSSDNKEILQSESRADTTKNGNVYYKSNTGKKLGTLLGLAIYPIANVAVLKLMKIPSSGKSVAVSSGITAVMGALGGFVLGAIADKCGNSAARKAADRQVLEA